VCAVIEEYAKHSRDCSDAASTPMSSIPTNGVHTSLVTAISVSLLSIINHEPPAYYHEVAPNLRRLSLECTNLLNSFVSDGHLARDQVPQIPSEIDGTGQRQDAFNVSVAEQVSGLMFEDLKKRCVKLKKKEASSYEARRATIVASIALYSTFKERHEVRSMAACASALVALKAVPLKVGSVVKNLMNGVKVCARLIGSGHLLF
jgi:TATA-binding protein-associated factor